MLLNQSISQQIHIEAGFTQAAKQNQIKIEQPINQSIKQSNSNKVTNEARTTKPRKASKPTNQSTNQPTEIQTTNQSTQMMDIGPNYPLSIGQFTET